MSKFNINAQIRLQAPQNLGAVVKNIRSQLQGITATVNLSVPPQTQRQLTSVNKSLSTTQSNLKNVNKVTKEVQSSITSFGEQAAFAGKRFIAFTIAGGSIIKFVGALKSGISSAIDFERQMNKVAQVTESSTKSVAGISKEISRLSKTFGASSTELSKAAITLAQAGLSAEDTRKSLQALAKTDLAPTFDNITNTTEGAIAIFRQFRIQAEDLESTLSSINAVAGKFAVESSDIVAAVRRTGGAFAAAGGSLNELLALFTSVRATTRESAESIATGFRTIFTRMQRLSTQNYLKNLGVDLQDLSGQFVGPYEAVRRLSVALEDLPGTDPRFSQIIEELGGFRQVSKVIPLIKEFGTAQKALNVAMSGSDSLSRDAARAQESLAVQIQKTKEEFAAMVRTMVDSKGFKSIITVLLKLSSALIKVVESLEPLIPIMTILAGIKIGGAIKPFLSGFKAKGGFGLASGGLVPGVGNRDTVPAALMPGEFVIRKKAVEAIGPSNLAMMNRGGPVVQKFAGGKKVRKTTYKYNPVENAKDFRSAGGRGKVFGAIFLQGSPREQYGVFDIFKSRKQKGIKAPFIAYGFNKQTSSRFKNVIDSNVRPLITDLGGILSDQIGIPVTQSLVNRKSIPNYDGMIGSLFEGALRTIGIPFDPGDNNLNFDFPRGLGSKSRAFNTKLANIPVDAKKSWNADARKSLKKKIINYYSKLGNYPEYVKADPKLRSAIQKENKGFGIQSIPHPPENMSKGEKGLLDILQSGSSEKITVDTFKNLGLIPETGDSRHVKKFIKSNPFWSEKLTYNNVGEEGSQKHLWIVRRSEGGEVPALLTPGEFVFDKKSVNRIGTPKLSQLNYADKFASGGLVPRGVGDIRRARRRRLSPEGDLTTQAQYYAQRRTQRFGKRFGKTEEDPRIQYYESTPTQLIDLTSIPEITKRFRVRYGNMVRSLLIAKLLKNPQREQILNFPPRGARFLGAGMEAMVFGDEKRAYRIARKGVRGLGSQRPQSSAVLQSLRTVDFGDMYGEILPLAQPLDQRLSKKKYADSFSAEVGSMKRHERIKSAILSRMGKEGFDVSESNIARGELHEGNIGIVKKKIKLIDPNIFREHSKGGKVNTMLTPGEFVVDRNSAQRIGGKNLKRMNRGGFVQGFQGGGLMGGGGFNNFVGAGFALSGISMLVDSFTGLNKTVDQVVSGLGQFLSNTALLTISFRTLNSFVQKNEQKIAQANTNIAQSSEKLTALKQERLAPREKVAQYISTAKTGRTAEQRLATSEQRIKYQYDRSLKKLGTGFLSRTPEETARLQKYASPDFRDKRLAEVRAKLQPRITSGLEAKQQIKQLRQEHQLKNEQVKKEKQYIKSQEDLIKSNEQYIKRVQTWSAVTATLIAAASVVGTALEKRGREALEAGTGGEGLFTTGKALSTAGQFGGIGAQLGAAFGPLGIAIGGVTGGLLGLTKGLFDARKEIENIKSLRQFNESIQKTSRVLDALEKKQTTFATASVQVNRTVQDSLNTLRSSTTTPETRQDILSKSKGELDKFNTYLNIAAKDVDTFDQFINKAGKETFNFVTYLQGISRYDLEQQFRTIIDGNIKARETQRKIIEVQDEYIRQVRDIINVSRAFETVASNMKKFDNNLELLSGLVEGTSSGFRILNESDFIASPGKIFDSKRFNDIIQRDIGRNPLLGGKFSGEATSIGDRLSKDLITSSQLVQDLPDIVFSFRESIKNLDTEGDALQQFLAKIKSAGKGFDSNFITTTISNVVQGLYADETKEEGFIEKLRKEPQAVIDAITSAFDPLSQTGQLIVSSMADEANRRLNFVSKLVDLTNKEIELRNKGVDILGQGEELRARAENRPLNLDLLQGLDIKKQLNILGDDFALLNNPMRIASELMKEQNDLRDSYNKLAKDGIDTDGKLTATIDTQQEKIGRLNSALQFLSDVSGRTAITMQKIEKEQAKNQFKYDLASRVTFATSPAELGNLERSLFATAQAAFTGSIDSVAPKLRGDVLSMLDTIGDVELGIFGGRSGTDIKADLIANKLEQIGLPPNEARAIADRQSEELKRQRENLDKQLKLAEDANNALLAMVGQTRDLVKIENIAAIEGFNKQIVDILKNQQVQRFTGQRNIAAESISNIGSSKFIFEELLSDKKLGKTELTPKENRQRIEAIANQYEQIKSVGEMIKAQEEYQDKIKDFRSPQNIIDSIIGEARFSQGVADMPGTFYREDVSLIDFMKNVDDFTKGMDNLTKGTLEAEIDKGIIGKTRTTNGQSIISGEDAASIISTALTNTANTLEKTFIDVNREISNLEDLFKKLGGMSQSDIIKISGGISGLDKSLKRIVVNGSIPDFGKQIVDLEKDIEDINKKLFEVRAKDKVGPSRKSLLASKAAFASGGFVYGSGSGDKVDAKLAPGEFVLSRKMVQDIGKENVFQMARGGSVRKFSPKTEEEAKREYERKQKLAREKWAKYEKENENKRWIDTTPLPNTIRKPLPDRFLPARGSDPYHTSRLIPDMDLGLKDRTQLRKRSPSDIAGDREFARIQKKQKETEQLGYDLARLENIKRRKERQKENETLNQRYAERTKQAERIKSRDLTERRYDSEQHDKDTYNREAKIRNQPTQDLIKDRINREKIEAEKQKSIADFQKTLPTPKRYEVPDKYKEAFKQADIRNEAYQIERGTRLNTLSKMSDEDKKAYDRRQDEIAKKTYEQGFSQADVRRVQDKAYQENLQEVERNRIQFYKQTVKKEKRSGILGVAKDFADLYSIGRKGADVVVPGLGTAADIAGVGTLTGMGIGAAGSLATRIPGVTRGIGAIKRGTNAITGSKYVKPAYNQLRGINIQSGRLGERINTRIAKGAESIVNFPGKLLSKTEKQIKRAYDSTGAGLSNITNELKGRAIARNIPRNIIDKSAVTQKVSQAGRSPFVTKTKMRFPAVAEEIKSPTIAKQPIIEPKKIPRIQKLRKLAKQRQLRKEEIMQDLGGYAKRENISENLLPLQHRRQISLSDNALQNIIKRGKLSKRTVGAATDKQIFLSEKLSPSRQLDIARHESIHILQERLRNFNHPIVQEKLSKFLKPFKKELLKLGYDPKRLNNKEAMAYILQQGNKIPKELRDMIGFQSGSFVSGYGSGDKVPALLEPGEFVLNRNAVSKIGAGKLTDLNTKYSRKGYQEGGTVTTTQTSPSMNMEPFLQFSKAMEGIVNKMESVANILNGLSLQHTFNGTVTVQIVGGQFMGQISKEMQQICNAEIKKVLGNFASKKLNIDNID